MEIKCLDCPEALYTVFQKNDTDVAHSNFDAHQSILVVFGRDIAERICYQMVICYPTCPTRPTTKAENEPGGSILDPLERGEC